MKALIEWLIALNAAPDTVRLILRDQGTDVDVLRAEATERLDQMRATVDTDPAVTAEAVQAVKTLIAAVTPIEDTGDIDPGTGQDDTADDSDDSESDEAETGDAVENTDTATEPTPETTEDKNSDDDGGGAVTLDNENQDNASAPEPAPAATEGDVVIPTEAFKAKSSTKLTMNRPGAVMRFTDERATNEQYQAFAGGTSNELVTVGDSVTHVQRQMDLLRGTRGSSDPRGVSLIHYKAREGAFSFHRDRSMDQSSVIRLMNEATLAHQNNNETFSAFCSPSVRDYKFCPLPGVWGLFGSALPIITTERGGIEWPSQPTIGSLWGQGIECRTEDEEAARAEEGTPKACTHLDCPTWGDNRNRICHICVTSDILKNRHFPEYTDQALRTFELMYEHWVNWQMLQLAISIADQQNGEIRWDTSGWGILQALKEKVGFALDTMTARSLENPFGDAVYNVAIPFWAYNAIKADAAKRVGADLTMMTLGRGHIETIIKGEHTVRFWPLMPWQIALTEDVPDPAMRTWMGSNTSLQNGVYPETMEILIWQQGALVGVREDFLDIRGRWDYNLQRQNQQLEWFAETEWNVIPHCGEVMHITLDICTAGRSGSLFEYPCNTAAPAPEELAGV